MSLSRSPQIRQPDVHDVDAVIQVLAELLLATSCARSTLRREDHAHIHRLASGSLPTGSNACSCSTRSSFTCIAGEAELISSRKIVPPSAAMNRPILSAIAPVNAPFTWPNSSDSSSVSGSDPHDTSTNGLSRRGER